jgi:site-specific recombinase XerD
MYEAIKRFFQHCAAQLADIDPKSAERLASGLTHWMRHTYGTHAVAAGMPLDVVQQNMGHASLDTTTGYTTSEERRRMKAAQAAWKKRYTGSHCLDTVLQLRLPFAWHKPDGLHRVF